LIALVAVIGCVAGYFQESGAVLPVLSGGFRFTAAIGLGAFFFVMVQFLTGSAWSVTVRRIMENIMITLPVGALLFIPIAFGCKDIYPWTNADLRWRRRGVEGKPVYLSQNFFVLRGFVYFCCGPSGFSRSTGNRPSRTRTLGAADVHRLALERAGTVSGGRGGTLASYDWLMSLDPSWYSTIFGLYILAGGALTFMSVVTLVCLGFRRAGF
jgi:hypothetical protein